MDLTRALCDNPACSARGFATDFQERLRQILQKDSVPIRSRRPELPEGLAAAIHRALAREPEGRFPDVAAFRAALLAAPL